MLERTMEDLIAAYPNEFFVRHKLTLRQRQGSFPGVGRFDLLFEDEFKTQIVMELKAVTAKYEDATQLAKYRDALIAQGTVNILMWLVAPSIPRSVRDFLDQVGIEYTEIHEPEFRRVAKRVSYSIVDHQAVPLELDIPRAKLLPVSKPKTHSVGVSDWFLNTDEGELPGVGAYLRMIKSSCVSLWGRPDRADPEFKLSQPVEGERVFLYLNRVGIIATGIFTHELPRPSDHIFGKESEREFSRTVANLIALTNDRALTVRDMGEKGYKLPTLRAFCKLSNLDLAVEMLKEIQARTS